MTDTISYHDLAAEQTALGVYILRPDLALKHGLSLGDMDAGLGHDRILAALLDQADLGDAGSFQKLHSELQASGHLNRLGIEDHRGAAYLFWLREMGQRSIPQDAEVARQQIKLATLRRNIATIGVRLGQVSGINDPDDMLTTASELSVDLELTVNDNGIEGDRPLPGLRSAADLLAMPEEPQQWIIPGLLSRQNRVILIAPEGAGKSVLSRQVATCVAAGVHPFLPRARYTPGRALIVDFENPPDIVRRNLAQHVASVGGLDAVDDRLHIWNWPAGVDIRTPGGRAMLVRAIEQTRPDIVMIGPLYKMADPKAGETHEEQASRMAHALDSIKTRYNVSLWIEHHMPKPADGKGRVAPFGASLWMRWPEFGIRMDEPTGEQERNVFTLGRFRGDREIRQWPDKLVRGAGRLMWSGMYDDAEAEAAVYRACEDLS